MTRGCYASLLGGNPCESVEGRHVVEHSQRGLLEGLREMYAPAMDLDVGGVIPVLVAARRGGRGGILRASILHQRLVGLGWGWGGGLRGGGGGGQGGGGIRVLAFLTATRVWMGGGLGRGPGRRGGDGRFRDEEVLAVLEGALGGRDAETMPTPRGERRTLRARGKGRETRGRGGRGVVCLGLCVW